MSRIVDLVQGSPEWHAYRATHFNASDAAAMLGLSPHESRGDLLRRMALGQTPDVSPAQQRVFDRGHEFEAQARPWAEEIVGDELFPVVLEADAEDWDGLPLSASVDGLTMLDDFAFEHKTLNESLATALDAGEIPEQYHPQMEQVLMLTGAEKVLFMASSGTREDMRHAWYESRAEMRERILAGWRQFAADMASYEPTEPTPEPVANPQDALPAVSVQVAGEIAVEDNLPRFGEALRAYVDRLNLAPKTDQDFADLDAACKALKKAEASLTSAEDNALAQASSLDDLRRVVREYRELARTTRLRAEKVVKAEKEARRVSIQQDALKAVEAEYRTINAQLADHGGPVLGIPADLRPRMNQAMKGKKTLASLGDAADQVVADAKIEARTRADKARETLAVLDEAIPDDYAYLFHDRADLALLDPGTATATVKARVADAKEAEARRIEAERARIRAEEAKAHEAERDQPTNAKPDAAAVRSEDPALYRTSGPATLNLSMIRDRLGFDLSAQFIEGTLGILPAETSGRAVLFHDADWPRICQSLVRHISQESKAA